MQASDDDWPPGQARPHVYFVTLGSFEAYVDGQLEQWRGGAAGAHQLQNMLGYLLSREQRFVTRDQLIEVAGGHGDSAPHHVIAGLRRLLSRWGIGEALVQRSQMIRLEASPLWTTDTALLTEHHARAMESLARKEYRTAAAALATARKLCRGAYLPTYDSVPEYSIEHRVHYWNVHQVRVLSLLARTCLELGEIRDCELGFLAITEAFEIDSTRLDLEPLRAELGSRLIGGAIDPASDPTEPIE